MNIHEYQAKQILKKFNVPVLRGGIAFSPSEAERIASEIKSNPKFISLTNQRETFTLFNKKDGKPIHNAVVWQCTRGQKICEDIFYWSKENFQNHLIDIIESPILGQKGNKEFFIYIKVDL